MDFTFVFSGYHTDSHWEFILVMPLQLWFKLVSNSVLIVSLYCSWGWVVCWGKLLKWLLILSLNWHWGPCLELADLAWQTNWCVWELSQSVLTLLTTLSGQVECCPWRSLLLAAVCLNFSNPVCQTHKKSKLLFDNNWTESRWLLDTYMHGAGPPEGKEKILRRAAVGSALHSNTGKQRRKEPINTSIPVWTWRSFWEV